MNTLHDDSRRTDCFSVCWLVQQTNRTRVGCGRFSPQASEGARRHPGRRGRTAETRACASFRPRRSGGNGGECKSRAAFSIWLAACLNATRRGKQSPFETGLLPRSRPSPADLAQERKAEGEKHLPHSILPFCLQPPRLLPTLPPQRWVCMASEGMSTVGSSYEKADVFRRNDPDAHTSSPSSSSSMKSSMGSLSPRRSALW